MDKQIKTVLTADVVNFEKGVNAAIAKMRKLEAEAKAATQATTTQLREIGKQTKIDISADTSKFQTGMNEAISSLRSVDLNSKIAAQSMSSQIGQVVTQAASAGKAVGAVGVAVGAVVASIGALVASSAAEAKELENLARLAKMGVSEFRAYAFATESVGISAEKLSDISKDVQDKIGDFIATGGGEFKDFFENIAPKVGLTAQALQKLSGPDALMAIKRAMDEANVSAGEQVFYLEAIANDAARLIPLLEKNGKGLKEQADRAKELGIALSDIENKKLIEAGKAAHEAGAAFAGLKDRVAAQFAPAFTDAMKFATELVVDFQEKVTKLSGTFANVARSAQGWKAVFSGRLSFFDFAIMDAKEFDGWLQQNASYLGQLDSKLVQLRGKQQQIAGEGYFSPAAIAAKNERLAAIRAEIKELENQRGAINELVRASGVSIEKAKELGVVNIKTSQDTTIAWKRASSSMSENARVSYESMSGAAKTSYEAMQAASQKAKEFQEKAFDQLKSKYQSYASDIKRIQDEMYGRERSAAEQLRDLQRGIMTPVAARNDRLEEIKQMKAELAGMEALFSEALGRTTPDITAAKQWAEQYSKLADTVKQKLLGVATDGEQNDKARIASVKMVTAEVEALLVKERTVADTLSSALSKGMAGMSEIAKKAGLGDLTEGMNEVEKAWLASWKNMGEKGKEEVETVTKEVALIGGVWKNTYSDAEEASAKATSAMLADLEKIKKAAASIKYPTMTNSGVKGYATGGTHPGGWRMVGERGPELEYTGPSRIFNNASSNLILRALQSLAVPKVTAITMAGSPAAAASGGNPATFNITINNSGGGSSLDAKRLTDQVFSEINRRWRARS